jgi:flagellar hook-associated protein 1 FlgK
MAGVADILDMGRRALTTHQRTISVLSHNISNVNTPGYSRQEAIYRTARSQDGFIGNGVEIQQVRRVVDQFLEAQIISEQSVFGRLGVEKNMLDRIEAVFRDGSNEGIDNAISEFFSAAHDLANNPSGVAERITLMERGGRLSQRFRETAQNLQMLRQDTDREMQARIKEVNNLAARIADLNLRIHRVENDGEGAHDLRDERTQLLNELSEKIEIHVFNDEGNNFNVIVGREASRAPIVMGHSAYSLSLVSNPDNDGFSDIVTSANSQQVKVTDALTSGTIGGLINLRDRLLPDWLDRLDKLAASIMNEFNLQHREGFGLDAATGVDFFLPFELSPTITPASTNEGSAEIIAVVAPPPENPDPLAPPPTAEPLQFDPYQLSFSEDQYTLRNIRTGGTSIPTVDPEIIFEGMMISVTGEMSAGDRFDISFHEGAATIMDVSISDPRKIAAATDAETLPGGNANMLLLAQLQEKTTVALGDTIQGFYGSFVGEVGSRSQQATTHLAVEETTRARLESMREEVQGVSLDEEMTRLIQFQRSYQASARMVTTADELFETVIGLKR